MSITHGLSRGAAGGHSGAMRLEPVRGARTVARVLVTLLGAGFALAVVMLWFSPGALWDGDVLLLKSILTVAMGILAWTLIQSGQSSSAAREVQVDLVRREVRVMRRGERAPSRVCSFDALGRAESAHGIIGLWDVDGKHLADVALHNRDAARLLTSALRDAGKL